MEYIFNLRRLLAQTITSEELTLELLFADDCVLLAHTEEALQAVVTRFSETATAVGLIIGLKKTGPAPETITEPTTHPRSALMGTPSAQLSSSPTLEVSSQMMQQ